MKSLQRFARRFLSTRPGRTPRPDRRRQVARVEGLERREVMAAIATPPIFQNPFMAANGFSEIHLNSAQTDTSSVVGPGGATRRGVQQKLIGPLPDQIAGTIAFNSAGQLITIDVGPKAGTLGRRTGHTLVLMDPQTLKVLAKASLPDQKNTNSGLSFAGGGYFYLDNQDRVVCVTADEQIRIYAVRRNKFVLARSYDLKPAINSVDRTLKNDDVLNSVLPDSSGNLWFITGQGKVGYVVPATGAIAITDLNAGKTPGDPGFETNTKSFATDAEGGVYVVTDYALYRLQAGAGGTVATVWRTAYDRGTAIKPGQNQQGSGTTPTAFDDFAGNQFVAIADNAAPLMHVNVYNRATGALVASQAVFDTLPNRSDTENSLIAVDHSILVENNYGNSSVASTLGKRTTAPGFDRVDFDPTTGQSRVAWDNTQIAVPSVVSQLSTADGLAYTYAKDARGWYWAALNYQTGQVVSRASIPWSTKLGGVLANNYYGGLTVGPNGTAYTGVFGGIVTWRPLSRPHPRAAAAHRP